MKLGSLYPGIVKNSDGDTSNVYLTTAYLTDMEKKVFPYLNKNVSQIDKSSAESLAAEWVRLFGDTEREEIDG